MPLFLTAAANPGAATWSNTTALGPTPYVVGPTQEYTTIQAAIDQAVADGKTSSDPAVVWIEPGTYVEDVAPADGVYLQAINNPGMVPISLLTLGGTSVLISGSVTVDLASGAQSGMAGISIEATAAAATALHLTGTADYSFYFSEGSVVAGAAAGNAILMDSTTAAAGGFSLRVADAYVETAATNANSTVLVQQRGRFTADRCTLNSVDAFLAGYLILETADSASATVTNSNFLGTFQVAAATTSVLSRCTGVAGFSTPIVANGPLVMDGGTYTNAFGAAVSGTGTVEVRTPINGDTASAANAVAPATVNMVELWDNSGTVGDWATSVPVYKQEALDRMVSLLVTLNGGQIP